MIIDAIDCLLCNAGCCNMKHVTLLKIGSGYVAEHFRSSNLVLGRVAVCGAKDGPGRQSAMGRDHRSSRRAICSTQVSLRAAIIA